MKFWGVVIGEKGVSVDPAKVKAVKDFPRPSTVKSLLGMVTYCARFMPNLADATAPLRKLSTMSEADFQWSEQCDASLKRLQDMLSNTRTLAYFNPEKATELVVDASPIGLGAILTQVGRDGKRHVVAYASKALSNTEQRYSQTEREALAIIWGAEQFKFYLLGCRFTCITDHKALVTLFNDPCANL